MSLLFEVPPNERELVFQLKTYKGNRVALKMLKTLDKDGVFHVRPVETQEKKPSKIYEISTISANSREEEVEILKKALISLIPKSFKKNYQFNFLGWPLGFTRSFEISLEGRVVFSVCHNIKEIRRDGTSHEPKEYQIVY
jgi:hypothetical protein